MRNTFIDMFLTTLSVAVVSIVLVFALVAFGDWQ